MLWIFSVVAFLLLLVSLVLYVPPVQNFVKDKLVSYLKKKTQTEIQLASIHLKFPKAIELQGLYIEDQQKDTLLYAGKLYVDISMLQLFNNKIDVQHAELENVTAHIYRKLPDTVYNFAFIPKAFSSPADTIADTTKSESLSFSLGKMELRKIYLTYFDEVSGDSALLSLGELQTTIDKFDLANPTYKIDQFKLSNVKGYYYEREGLIKASAEPIKEKEAASKLPDIGLHSIALEHIDLLYKNAINGTYAALKLNDFNAKVKSVDLNTQAVEIKSLQWDGLSAIVALDKSASKPDTATIADTTQNNWHISLHQLNVNNTSIKYDNNLIKPLLSGIDYNHLALENVLITASDILYSPKGTSANVANLRFKEKSGFELKKLKGLLTYDDKGASLKEFELITNHSAINSELEVTYPSLAVVSKDIGLLGINAQIKQLDLGTEDLAYFQPELLTNVYVKKLRGKTFHLQGDINGRVNDLKIENLLLTTSATKLYVSGSLKGLPNVEKGIYDIQLHELSTTNNDIASLVPPNLLPPSINLPGRLLLKGDFKGSVKNFKTNATLASTLGTVQLNAQMIEGNKPGYEQYQALVNVKELNVGKLLKQEQHLGKVSLTAAVKGRGTKVSTANAWAKGLIRYIDYKGYRYSNLNLRGSLHSQLAELQAEMTDPNLSFTLNGAANLGQKYPSVNLSLVVDSANLTALNLTTDHIKFRGELKANLPTADPDYLNGRVDLFNFLITKEKLQFPIDSVQMVAITTADSSSLFLKSPIVNASLKGKYQLSNIGSALNQIINSYYKNELVKKNAFPPQQMELKATISSPKFVQEFFPELKRFETATVNGTLNSASNQFSLKASLPSIVYQQMEVDSLQLAINTDSSKLAYRLSFDKFVHPELTMYATQLKGKAFDNQLTLDFSVDDNDHKEKYFLEGNLKSENNVTEFRLGKHLLLNYEDWQVPDDNYLKYSAKGIIINKLEISDGHQQLKINSKTLNEKAPVVVLLKDFNLETLTKFAEQDSAFVGGTINGTATIENVTTNALFVTDLSVDRFRFKTSVVGDIRIKVDNRQTNAYNADVSISGMDNDVKLNGVYFTKPQSAFDLNLVINKLNLKSIESFTFGQIKNSTGFINGKTAIKGTVDKPDINGEINFNQAGFLLSYLNSYFSLQNEKISINQEGIHFNEFTIQDSAKNEAVINGSIYTKAFTDYSFGLTVTTDNFRALNTKQNNNDLYYGPVYIDSDIKITGTLDQPKANINAKLREKSVFTVVLPTATASVVDREGVIEFVDMDLVRKGITLTYEDMPSATSKTTFKGFELSATIEIDKDAELHIIVDQQSGDNLRVKGAALMNATMDLSGKLSLTGTYLISEGSYELSMSGLIRRKFNIKEGSSITWTGEPTSANVDITAVYSLETSAMELFENQVNSASATDRNKYKQKLPFEVNLIIKNELLHPEISFQLDMPEEERSRYEISSNVYNRIKQINTDESELNKQVLGLLVMNRFIASDPFSSLQSSGGGGVESLARQSASKLLSEQLNNLAGDLIKGVDLSFDLASEEDYSSGKLENRTDLNVGVSKELFGGRTSVYVGSNFELEGQDTPNKKSTNIAGDVAIEYKLSRDGRYKLRAYRKDEYQSIIEGQVIETGLSFILTMDYDHFKELFHKSKDRSLIKSKKKNKKAANSTADTGVKQ
ncbi:translocation/assembly module TamB domain-containing protein [Solitalea sp. MAHUQ-68]|uniref:Translocation/assembly module TamB domain-containing protein n=1 Tax=Solitalea agri TaxID=2953739 RepID=A0A9X2F5J6_9SPHI|nr:translocation/assembly module TamB domain-containing protein [Solitalea agri]MCO4294660.1 translocation/assembly module TamB domain-containing protein [Solitalea agri]